MNTYILDKYRRTTRRWVFFVVVCLAGLFGQTISNQAVFYADSSDLVLASTYAGLAHPPGYPLYVVILHTVFTAFPSLSKPMVAGWFAAVCMAGVGGLLLFIINGLTHRIFDKKVSFGLLVLVLFLWMLIPFNWTFATVPEIMPLALLLLVGLLITVLEPLYPLLHRPRYAVWVGFWGMMAGLFHPLLFGIVIWIWAVWACYWARSWRHWWAYLLCGIIAGTLLTVLLYGFIVKQNSWYGWQIPRNVTDWWRFWSRQVYTESGSAIETLSKDFRLSKIVDSLYRWWRWWNVEQQAWLLSALSIVGFIALIWKRRIRWLIILLIPIVVYGLGLPVYLKHPESYALSETGVWWGIALRERMFYIIPLLVIFPVSVGAVSLSWLMPVSSKIKRLVAGILICIGLVLIMGRYAVRKMPTENAGKQYISQVLVELPSNALLLVDDDDVFGLLFIQSILSIRKDVTIVPVGMILMPQWWETYQYQIARNGFTTNKLDFIRDVVSTSLSSHRRIFLYGIDADDLELLGVEGNPYFARPHGYTLEVMNKPFMIISPADYGLSVQVAAMKTLNVDSWFRGFRTHLGMIHAQQAYFLARLGPVSYTHLRRRRCR